MSPIQVVTALSVEQLETTKRQNCFEATTKSSANALE